MPRPQVPNPFRTFQGRLATTYAGLALLAVVVSAVYTTSSLRGVVLERIGVDLEDEARIIADSVAEPLARGDSAGVAASIARADALTRARIVVVNRDGVRVAATDPAPNELQVGEVSLQEALNGKSFVLAGVARGGSHEVVQVTQPIFGGDGRVVGALRASYNLEDVEDTVARLNAATIVGALGAAILAAGLGVMLATTVARPVRRVAQSARDLAAGRLATRFPEPAAGTDEIRALIGAFTTLADQLTLLEQARREFASDVSHELHALASAMQTGAEALQRGAAEADPALSERLVAGLVGHTRRLTRLADDLLELARWEGGRLRLDRVDFDVADLVEGVRDEWTAEAERRGLVLETRLPGTSMPLHGDPIRLAQALGNLVENAIKYAGTGGRVRLESAWNARRRTYELAVADSGPGIPADVLPRVFDRYYRVEGRVGGGPGGMGLGLAIARAIAVAHGGELTAESPPGGGARFTLRLPRAAARSPTS